MLRPHGLRGEVVVRLVSTVAERVAPGSTLEYAGGQLVVESARALPAKADRHATYWLVRFAGVATRDAAAALAGAVLRAEPLTGVGGLWVHELVGSEVFGTSGEHHGTVVAVEANPASDLLVLDSGTLVPLRFVVGSLPGRLTVEVPEGLFEP